MGPNKESKSIPSHAKLINPPASLSLQDKSTWMSFGGIASVSVATNDGIVALSPNGCGGGDGVASPQKVYGSPGMVERMCAGFGVRVFSLGLRMSTCARVKFASLSLFVPSPRARPNEISASFAALAHGPELASSHLRMDRDRRAPA